jgi:hypothetical protein
LKKRIGKLLGMALLVAAIVFSVIQLNTTPVKASGAGDCPQGSEVFCGNCWLTYATVEYIPSENLVLTECHYDCYCSGGGGGGEPFYIEQTVQLYD